MQISSFTGKGLDHRMMLIIRFKVYDRIYIDYKIIIFKNYFMLETLLFSRMKVNTEEWKAEQDRIRGSVSLEDHNLSFKIVDGQIEGLTRVAGVDLSFVPESNLAIVAIAIVSFPDLKLVHLECDAVEVDVPYIPGFLAFREIPAIQTLAKGLMEKVKPDDRPQVFLVDGNGQMHPRGAGIASHLGVLQDWPTIGCSKSFFKMDGWTSKLVDEIITPRLIERSNIPQPHELIIGKTSGRLLGAGMLNGRKKTKNPIFVSVGHRVSFDTALQIVKACSIYRVPEPIRLADKLSREQAQSYIKQ